MQLTVSATLAGASVAWRLRRRRPLAAAKNRAQTCWNGIHARASAAYRRVRAPWTLRAAGHHMASSALLAGCHLPLKVSRIDRRGIQASPGYSSVKRQRNERDISRPWTGQAEEQREKGDGRRSPAIVSLHHHLRPMKKSLRIGSPACASTHITLVTARQTAWRWRSGGTPLFMFRVERNGAVARRQQKATLCSAGSCTSA